MSIRKTRPDQLLSDADRRASATLPSVSAPKGAIRRRAPACGGDPAGAVPGDAAAGAGGERGRDAGEPVAAGLLCRVDPGVVGVQPARRATPPRALRQRRQRSGAAGRRVRPPRRLSWSFTIQGPTESDEVRRYALAGKVRRAAFVACISDCCRSQLLKLAEFSGRCRRIEGGDGHRVTGRHDADSGNYGTR